MCLPLPLFTKLLRGLTVKIEQQTDKGFAVKNKKRKQLNIKEIKVYSSKQSMTSCGSIKTKMYIKWWLTLTALL